MILKRDNILGVLYDYTPRPSVDGHSPQGERVLTCGLGPPPLAGLTLALTAPKFLSLRPLWIAKGVSV